MNKISHDEGKGMRTIKENTKITLTLGQLRMLVKESGDLDDPLFGKSKQSAKRFIFKVIGDHKGMFRDDNWKHVHEIFGRMRKAGLDLSYGPVNDREHSGGYFRNERGKIAGKEWEFSVDFINDRDRECTVTGRVMACFGGTVEQMDNDDLGPDRPYDITVLFTC